MSTQPDLPQRMREAIPTLKEATQRVERDEGDDRVNAWTPYWLSFFAEKWEAADRAQNVAVEELAGDLYAVDYEGQSSWPPRSDSLSGSYRRQARGLIALGYHKAVGDDQ